METNFNKPNPKKILGYLMAAFAMVFFTITASAQCADDEITITLEDSYGDNWNGNILTVDGVTYTIDASSASQSLATFTACVDLSCGDLLWDYAASGSWQSENSWSISDANGVLASSNYGWPDYDSYPESGNLGAGGTSVTITLEDSYGDNWNGNSLIVDGVTYTIDASSASQSIATFTACLDLTSCISWSYVNSGSWQSENSWSISDDNGVLASSNYGWPDYDSYPESGNLGFCGVLGCMDSTACNYDALATTDDNSCFWAATGYDCAGNCLVGTATDITVREISSGGSMYTLVGYGGDWSLVDGNTGAAIFSSSSTDDYSDCLADGCYEISGISGSFGYAFAYSIDGGVSYTTPGTVNVYGTDQFTIGSGICYVYGCTDSTAANYDSTANYNDGSCNYGTPGCTDLLACNYDSTATADDGSCTYAQAPLDCNGDCANGGTQLTLTLSETYSWGAGWGGRSLEINGTSYTTTMEGSESFVVCADTNACIDAVFVGATSTYYSWSLTDANGSQLMGGGTSAQFGPCPIFGCIDSTAVNYDAGADTDDGSCCYDNLYTVNMFNSLSGYSWAQGSGEAYLVVSSGDTLNKSVTGSSLAHELCLPDGCWDITFYDGSASYLNEYSWNVVDNNGTIVASGGSYVTSMAPYADSHDFGNTCPVFGCTNPVATNYDSAADTDDGSCLIEGCTDSTALDYNPDANVHTPCTYCVDGCMDSTAFNYDSTATCDDGSCIAVVEGCTDTSAFNYDSSANTDDGSCEAVLLGCTDPNADNYYSSANTDDGSCDYSGCTDSTATNYDPNATVDDGSCISADVYGCTDPSASNHDPLATIDDGSCIVACTDYVTGLNATILLEDRVELSWDNMNTSNCKVTKYNIRFRELGSTGAWLQRGAGWLGCSTPGGLQKVDKMQYNLSSNTTYEWKMKVWYCDGNSSYWGATDQFTTQGSCPPLTNLAVQTFAGNHERALFTWDSTGTYQYARVKCRVDTPGGTWLTVGGFGVYSPTLEANKFGLVEGESYRAQARAICHPIMSAWASGWTPLIFWDQPAADSRVEGGTTINNLDVYPNPSRDVFNVSFISEDVQDLEVRVINVVGEVIYTENLEQFVGEYTKQVDLATYTKGIYFLEITTNNGVVNKKLMLQ